PGCMMKVMTSLATPPTMKTGDCVPIPDPVLFTWTAYPGAAPFVVQYTRKSWFDVQLAPSPLSGWWPAMLDVGSKSHGNRSSELATDGSLSAPRQALFFTRSDWGRRSACGTRWGRR